MQPWGYDGRGDFMMDETGRLARRGAEPQAPFVYAGAGIFHAGLFADTPDGAFSLNVLFDRAIAAGRLYGLRLDGTWLHVGTPDAITEAEAQIAKGVLNRFTAPRIASAGPSRSCASRRGRWRHT